MPSRMDVDVGAPKHTADVPPSTPLDANNVAAAHLAEKLSIAQEDEVEVVAAASCGQGGSNLCSVLAAFAANFQCDLQGQLPDMISNSLAGLLGPIEWRQAEHALENQRRRQDINRIPKTHALR